MNANQTKLSTNKQKGTKNEMNMQKTKWKVGLGIGGRQNTHVRTPNPGEARDAALGHLRGGGATQAQARFFIELS